MDKKISGIILPGSEDTYRFIPETVAGFVPSDETSKTNQAADAGAVKNALDKKLDGEGIVTDLSPEASVTNQQVPGAKAVQDAIKNIDITDVVYFDENQVGPPIENPNAINADSFGGVAFKDFFDKSVNKTERAASVQSLENAENLANKKINNKIDKNQIKTYKNIIISNFTTLQTPLEDYAVKGEGTIEGIDENSYLLVNFSKEDIITNNFASFVESTNNNKFYIYAKENPNKTITVPSVIVYKEVIL